MVTSTTVTVVELTRLLFFSQLVGVRSRRSSDQCPHVSDRAREKRKRVLEQRTGFAWPVLMKPRRRLFPICFHLFATVLG